MIVLVIEAVDPEERNLRLHRLAKYARRHGSIADIMNQYVLDPKRPDSKRDVWKRMKSHIVASNRAKFIIRKVRKRRQQPFPGPHKVGPERRAARLLGFTHKALRARSDSPEVQHYANTAINAIRRGTYKRPTKSWDKLVRLMKGWSRMVPYV